MSEVRNLILIVEDDDDNRQLTRDLLDLQNYDILEAANGLQALDLLNKHRPHLILMDVAMPGLNGLEVTRRIRQNESLAHIPIIALTAYAGSKDQEAALAAGCTNYVSKPINIQELLSKIETHIQPSTPP